VIQNFYSIICLLALLMSVAFVNSAATRDFAHNTAQILFATPLKKFNYLFGRYLGSAAISVIPLLGVSIGILVAKYMPWNDPERWGPIHWMAHLNGILLFAIPNSILIAAIIFAIAIMTRNTVVSFVGGLVLLTGYGVGDALVKDIRHERIAAILDPFGIRTFALVTKYWTVFEKNHNAVGYGDPLLVWNRVLWLSVSALIFAFAYSRFRFEERAVKPKKVRVKKTKPEAVRLYAPTAAARHFGVGAQLTQFFGSTRIEFLGLVKSIPFIVITLAALLNCVPSLLVSGTDGYGNSSFPVTYYLIEIIQGTLFMFLFAMITYYAGVLVWKERDAGIEDIHDALPHREWPMLASKLVALLVSIFLILIAAMISGLLVQFFHDYHRYQLGLWFEDLLFIDFTIFAFFVVLAYFLHVIAPNKYIGYFAFIAFGIFNLFAWRPLHVATYLVQFGARPGMNFSDFFHFEPYWQSWGWFTFYWGVLCVLLIFMSLLLWPRGRETSWRYRLHEARGRWTGSMRAGSIVLLAAFVTVGGWAYYNTEVLNHLRSEQDDARIAADYEKAYSTYKGRPEPRITDIKYTIDLYPEHREAVMRADQIIKNETSAPIGKLHLTSNPDLDTKADIDGARLSWNNDRLRFSEYDLNPPMGPGEERHMRYTVARHANGFENKPTLLEIAENGTFFNNQVAPQIGYQPRGEIKEPNKRKRFGLKPKDPMPALERNCTVDCRNNYLSNNSDLVNVDTVISTSPDQIAIAPGSLKNDWYSGGRHYYHYSLDHPAWNFYSFLSARYKVSREKWNDLNTEVYYLAEQPWNVARMQSSMHKSFDYYTTNFGPYYNREARIIEFPRIARFAQAFPGTMPYSEAIGFIANLNHPDDIDMVYYVVAHEMGHQYWGYQVMGANMQGATLLSETLAQYSALMVMEKAYGRDLMRKFLKYEMDNYLRSRGRELLKERPLIRVDSEQGYIHYRKGSVVMYYLKEMIGEDAVNRAIRKVLDQYRYAGPPYPVSYALVDALQAETPPNLQYLIKDLFYDITLFSNRTTSATSLKRPDGKYDVTIKVDAHKFKADEKGNEHEVPVNDWIDIGAFAKPPEGKKYGATLYRDRRLMHSGPATYTFTVDKAPDTAGIDPFDLLIDRVPDDNTKPVTINTNGTAD
jgi:ABC-2 type transport system permease protein